MHWFKIFTHHNLNFTYILQDFCLEELRFQDYSNFENHCKTLMSQNYSLVYSVLQSGFKLDKLPPKSGPKFIDVPPQSEAEAEETTPIRLADVRVMETQTNDEEFPVEKPSEGISIDEALGTFEEKKTGGKKEKKERGKSAKQEKGGKKKGKGGKGSAKRGKKAGKADKKGKKADKKAKKGKDGKEGEEETPAEEEGADGDVTSEPEVNEDTPEEEGGAKQEGDEEAASRPLSAASQTRTEGEGAESATALADALRDKLNTSQVSSHVIGNNDDVTKHPYVTTDSHPNSPRPLSPALDSASASLRVHSGATPRSSEPSNHPPHTPTKEAQMTPRRLFKATPVKGGSNLLFGAPLGAAATDVWQKCDMSVATSKYIPILLVAAKLFWESRGEPQYSSDIKLAANIKYAPVPRCKADRKSVV